ncbi:MAG TPA: hypothetical protein VGO69_10875 [Pyrinomonadaceae bacterium]|nr:hypothetical protein [Pyrinomonadaceae bacterium]
MKSQIVIKKSFALFLALSFALISLAAAGVAQTKPVAAAAATTTQASMNSSLRLLPPSDLVAFVNVKRLITEAAPKVFADNPTKLAEFNADIDQFKTKTGLDARSFTTIAVGLRYQHPSPGITTADTVVIANGTFNAGVLLAAARLASQGKYQEQKYKDATIYIFSVNDTVNIPGLVNMKVKELAVTTIDANTLALGELAAVRATLDNKSRAGVNNDLINLATRSPNALIGFSANVPPSLSQGVNVGNDEIGKLVGSIRQAYGAIGTTTGGFDMLAVARTENAGQAQSLSDTISSLKQFGGILVGQLPVETGKVAQNALDNLKIGAQGNETSIKLELQQADIQTLMRVLKPKATQTR